MRGETFSSEESMVLVDFIGDYNMWFMLDILLSDSFLNALILNYLFYIRLSLSPNFLINFSPEAAFFFSLSFK